MTGAGTSWYDHPNVRLEVVSAYIAKALVPRGLYHALDTNGFKSLLKRLLTRGLMLSVSRAALLEIDIN